MTVVEIGALGGLLTAAVGAIAVMYKLKPARDALVLTNVQGSFVILNDLTTTLQTEVTRLNALLVAKDLRISALEAENEGLRRRFGSRRQDSKEAPDG